ncbi:MAG: GFA family protein [Parvibaculum sp.]|nr:GFA family protein [Parvibaculum sp.]|tara:strand:+ start:6993 stop:7469 length:477 start_codon:yes stop_codon:yes gene_type:complete
MNEWNLPWEGGCRCGQLRFKVSAAPLITMACHCVGCQRMTASAYSLSVLVAIDGFEITKGEPVIGGMHEKPIHYFCPHCMSWVFTRFDEASPFMNLRATMLDDATWFEPFIESCVPERLPWAQTTAIHQFDTFPTMDDYPALIQEFAEKGKRPVPLKR